VALQKINFGDQNSRLIQDNVDAALTKLQNGQFVGGQSLGSVSLKAASDNVISHALGYSPVFVITSLPNVQSTVWNTAKTTNNVTLKCSADCTVSLWVK
jgi:hypothetical protein